MNRSTQTFFLALVAVALWGCGDDVAGPGDPDPGIWTVSTPSRGALEVASPVTVSGQVVGASAVSVNGEVAVVRAGAFEISIRLDAGTQLIETRPVGASGQELVDLRSVSVGQFAEAGAIDSSTRIQLGPNGLFGLTSDLVRAVDQATLNAALVGAIIKDEGSELGCDLDRLTVATASAPISSVALFDDGGLFSGETTHNPFSFTLAAVYSDSTCSVVSAEVGFETEEIHVRYEISPALEAGTFSAVAIAPSSPLDHEIVIDGSNLDPVVAARVLSGLSNNLADVVINVATPLVMAEVNRWLNSFARDDSIQIGAAAIRVRSEPSALTIGPSGLELAFGRESSSVADEPAYVATDAPTVTLASTHAALALFDDSINQALGAVWRGGGIATLTPPNIRKAIDGSPEIVFGDLVVGAAEAQSVISGRLILESTQIGGELGLRVARLESSTSSLAGAGAPTDAVDEAVGALKVAVDGVLATYATPVAAYAWPAVEAIARPGHVTIDTMQ